MSNHTPGPWTWWTSNSWCRLKHDDRGKTLNVLEPYVARDGHPDLDISQANMNLIAAAPDMLAALRMVASNHDPDHFLDAVEAAIAKAEGSPLTGGERQ